MCEGHERGGIEKWNARLGEGTFQVGTEEELWTYLWEFGSHMEGGPTVIGYHVNRSLVLEQ